MLSLFLWGIAWLLNKCLSIMLNFKLKFQNICVIPLQTKSEISKMYIFKLQCHCAKLEDMDKMLFLLESKWPFHVVISKGHLINREALDSGLSFVLFTNITLVLYWQPCEDYTWCFWKTGTNRNCFPYKKCITKKTQPFSLLFVKYFNHFGTNKYTSSLSLNNYKSNVCFCRKIKSAKSKFKRT